MAVKVGIIGCKGFVGSAFLEVFSNGGGYAVTGIDKDNCEALKGTRFDILVNCNGNSSKRLADSEPKLDWEMNVGSTRRFLQYFPCSHYIHISTVEVYNDKSDPQKCREDSGIDPSALSNYGKSKYAGEQIARSHPSFLILRLAGMVGKGMKKGPAYDILEMHKLFLSEKSELHFMGTPEVARIAKLLAERGKWGETYNVVGKGSVKLSGFASIAGSKLSGAGKEEQVFRIPTAKIEGEAAISTSEDALRGFVEEWKKGKR